MRSIRILRELMLTMGFSYKMNKYLDAVAEEPFRLFFPLGWIAGILGVSLWPLFLNGIGSSLYPGIMHARVMIECFVGAFIVGFLGTAVPRLLGVPRLRYGEVWSLAVLHVVCMVFHLLGKTRLGDIAFLLFLLGFCCLLLFRAPKREDVPPPGFCLVVLGMLSGICGTFLLLLEDPASTSEGVYRLARLLLFQGFWLFPLMGVGVFFFPKLFRTPNRQHFPESRSAPPGWWNRACFSLFCGGVVFLSFFLDAYGFNLRVACFIRALGIVLIFACEIPYSKVSRAIGAIGYSAASGLVLLVLGYLCECIWPEKHLAMVHILYIGGMGSIIFAVASRVLLGHSGQSGLFFQWIGPVVAFQVLTLLGLVARIVGDFYPHLQSSHYNYAAYSWIAGSLVWGLKMLSCVFMEDPE